MTDPEEYLNKTESAVVKLFEGIDSYLKIPKVVIYIGDAEDNDAWQYWLNKNRASIQSSLKSQKEFFAENFALATLCGSLLQIASMGIQLFSKNKNISEKLPKNVLKPLTLMKPKKQPVKFCTGRLVSQLPIGLIIYAGRNQYNHMDEDELFGLNKAIFNQIAEKYDDDSKEFFKDPAFDLENRLLINFSSNITSLLGWKNYESYYSDMKSLIVSV
jgi:hypothetical protein